MATIIQRPDALSLVGNLKKFILASGSPISFELKKGGGASIYSGIYTPSTDGSVTIDLREIIESTLSFSWSSSADPYINTGISSQFSAVIDDATITFIVVKAGVSQLADTPANFLTQNFLTWQPQEKQVTYYTPEFLSYYAAVAGVAKLKAYFQVEGVTTDTTITLGTLVAGSAYTFPLQYGNVVGKLSNRLPSFYDVWVEDPQGTRLSYVQRYVASPALSEQEQWILFANSLGGLDTFRAYGSSELEADHTHNIAVIDDISSEYKVDTERKFNKNTGHLDRYSRKWLLDFFPSLSKFIYEGSVVRQIVVLDSDVSYKDLDLPSSYTFTYKYADARPYLNLSRSEQLSSDLNISIPDLGSFTLPPRLAEVSRLPLSEGALFPVQSPYSEQWATTTAGALLSFIAQQLATLSGASGGGVGHSHANYNLLNLLQHIDGYLKINGVKINAGMADDLTPGSSGAQKYVRKDIEQDIAATHTFRKGLVAYALSGSDGIIESDEDGDGIKEMEAIMPVTLGELTNVSDDADTAVDDAILVKRGNEYIPYTGLFTLLAQMQEAIKALQGGGPSPVSYTVFFGTASSSITEALILANFDGRLTQSKGNIACELSGSKQSEDYVFIAFLAVWGDLSTINIVTSHNENIPQTNWFNPKQLITIGSSQYNLYVSKSPIDGTSSFMSIF